jgi:hypothetical protein
MAQAADSSVHGQIADGVTGNPVAGASVTFFPQHSQNPVKQATTDSGGNYNVTVAEDSYKVSAIGIVGPDRKQVTRYFTVKGADLALNMTLIASHLPGGEFARLIYGLNQAAASSANATWKYFFDLSLSVPVPIKQATNLEFGPWLRAWSDIRIDSVPQQVTSQLSSFNLATSVANLQVNQLAQAIEFRGGLSARVDRGALKSFHLSFDNSTIQKFTTNIIAGGGAVTPLNPRDTLDIYLVSPDAVKLFPQAQGKQYIGFTSADRDRFYRQAFGGFQFKTYYFDKDTEQPLDRFPATFDLTYGIDESVTRGYIRGGVFRTEMFYPLPTTWGSNFYFFFSAFIKPTRSRSTEPLLLQSAPSTIGLSDLIQNGVRVSLPQIDRDYYRVGIGMDLIRLVQVIQNHGKEPGQTTK